MQASEASPLPSSFNRGSLPGVIAPATAASIPDSSVSIPPQSLTYASPWRRLGAAWIDAALITLVNYLFIVPILELLGMRAAQDPGEGNMALSVAILGAYGSSFLVLILTSWIYHAYMESKYGATFGKRWLGLRVENTEGGLLSFAAATIRYFTKFISRAAFYLGYVMCLFNARRQCLHDSLAGAVVLQRVRPIISEKQEAIVEEEEEEESIDSIFD